MSHPITLYIGDKALVPCQPSMDGRFRKVPAITGSSWVISSIMITVLKHRQCIEWGLMTPPVTMFAASS
jgi:hypothetical protein